MTIHIALNKRTKLATVSYDVDCLPPDTDQVINLTVPDNGSERMIREAQIAFSLGAYGYEIDYTSWEVL
jgi:hypothetical protein